MVTYEITASVGASLCDAYERYMRQRHIPDVLGSECFQGAVFTNATPGRYRIRYEAVTADDLERYLATHAPRLREDFAAHFPQGVVLSREVWVAIQSWDVPAPAAG